MKSNEEYLLRALRRTISGLADSLIPAHSAKLAKLLERFESADSVTEEVRALLNIQGFGKCALTMEWLLERTKHSVDNDAPEQFESDALLLNEKLFEAFLNQPFDMPDYSRTFEAPARPIQQNIQISDDEFLGTSYSAQGASSEPEQSPAPYESITEPNWDTSTSLETSASHFTSSPAVGSQTDASPSLRDVMNADLFESTERIAQTALEFIDKQPNERPIAMAVLRVTVRAALESTKISGIVIAQDLFESLLRLIAYADEHEKIRTDDFADIIRDVGDRLSTALKQSNSGITFLKNITNYINNPKDLFKK
jgi:hypothetical protein